MDMDSGVGTYCGNGGKVWEDGQRGKFGTTVLAQTIKKTKKSKKIIAKK